MFGVSVKKATYYVTDIICRQKNNNIMKSAEFCIKKEASLQQNSGRILQDALSRSYQALPCETVQIVPLSFLACQIFTLFSLILFAALYSILCLCRKV